MEMRVGLERLCPAAVCFQLEVLLLKLVVKRN